MFLLFSQAFSQVQQLNAPLDYVTLELLGWSYDSYNAPPSLFDGNNINSDVRANGEGTLGHGAILRTTDIFLSSQYTDVNQACNNDVSSKNMMEYCHGGQDRQCVRALGRYLDRFRFSVWLKDENDGGVHSSYMHDLITLETMHAGGTNEGACLHFDNTEKDFSLCGGQTVHTIEQVTVWKNLLSKKKKECVGFSFGGTDVCLNNVNDGDDTVASLVDLRIERDNAMRMVCLGLKWSALKYSSMPDKQVAVKNGGEGCVWN